MSKILGTTDLEGPAWAYIPSLSSSARGWQREAMQFLWDPNWVGPEGPMGTFWKVMLQRIVGNFHRQKKSNLAGAEVMEQNVLEPPREEQSALQVPLPS